MPRLAALLVACAVLTACPRNAARRQGGSVVVLDGTATKVRWSDGDTFKVLEGPLEGQRARLTGFNTLEDYGPVHRWGQWTAKELYALAQEAGRYVEGRQWTCQRSGDEDGYGRLLLRCPEVARALVHEGLAMAYSVEGPADAALLEVQKQAQEARRGMWAKGVPAKVMTSVHSVGEKSAYNRAVDTRTGYAKVFPHQETYQTCQEVCLGDPGAESCLVYVPYEQRYGPERAACLKAQ